MLTDSTNATACNNAALCHKLDKNCSLAALIVSEVKIMLRAVILMQRAVRMTNFKYFSLNLLDYGYSGPYPNTEYSNSSPVQAAVVPSYNEVGSHTHTSPNLGAADVANYLRGTKSHQQNGGGGNNNYLATPILLDPLPLSSDKNSKGTKGDSELVDDGNFDLNLEFNEDDSGYNRRSENLDKGKNKKLSSKFKAGNGFDSFIDSGQGSNNQE